MFHAPTYSSHTSSRVHQFRVFIWEHGVGVNTITLTILSFGTRQRANTTLISQLHPLVRRVQA